MKFLLPLTLALILTGCTDNYTTKTLGGNTVINLPPNQKLITVTWKDNQLWYLYQPMSPSDTPTTNIFQEKSEYGILQGNVTIIESK
jgi:hypothetical protein